MPSWIIIVVVVVLVVGVFVGPVYEALRMRLGLQGNQLSPGDAEPVLPTPKRVPKVRKGVAAESGK